MILIDGSGPSARIGVIMSNVRPYFDSSIEELETECAGDTHLIDRETRRQVEEELSFRRGSKRVRALAKQLGCQWKVRATNASQTGVPIARVSADIAGAFGLTNSASVEVL